MIGFIADRQPDHEHVRRLLRQSADDGVWTNFGPVSRSLEDRIAELLELPAERRVVACGSGTLALYALVSLYGFIAGRELRWVVSAFTFACQRQGPLARAKVVDCDSLGGLDLEAVRRLPPSSYDGIVVTNLFGKTDDARAWTELARELDKKLIFDSATCFLAAPRDQRVEGVGDGEAFSFHHTKPCGFGEGGCVVVPRELVDPTRSIINFGRYAGIDTGRFSFNGKMSDVAAAFIIDRLRTALVLRDEHREQWRRIVRLAAGCGVGVLNGPEPGFPNVAALTFARPIETKLLSNDSFVLRKLYLPLSQAPTAQDLFARIVCVPCHGGVAAADDEQIEGLLRRLSEAAGAGDDPVPSAQGAAQQHRAPEGESGSAAYGDPSTDDPPPSESGGARRASSSNGEIRMSGSASDSTGSR